MSQDRTERKGSQVVHVRENSDTELEALFNFAINPSDNKGSIPFRMRNLPPSFFNPGAQKHIGHIREDSSDSTGGYPATPNSVGGAHANVIAHSRAHSSPASLQQTLSAAPPQLPPPHTRQQSCDILSDDQPLPPGWDMAKTPQGQRYFLNHLSQSTQWTDPRKSLNTSGPQQDSPIHSGPSSPQNTVSVDKVPLPPGWEQAFTADGEVYYINHLNRTTSWFHPGVPHHLQRPGMRMQQQQQQQQQQQMAANPASPQGQGQRPIMVERLQRLQLEKELLKKRQEEIARQEMMIRTGNLASNTAEQQQQEIACSQSNEMTSITDPFLGQSSNTDLHSRQESADSGLGGMGTSYSLPRTPEDLLGNMEEMDTQDGGPKIPGGAGDFGSMDISNVVTGDGGDNSNMESEDLVPSLQEDISSDLLKDVETVLNSNKIDNLLTWL